MTESDAVDFIEGADNAWLAFYSLPMQQNILAPFALDRLVKIIKPARIIEIGTATGGFSILLNFAANEFVTYDIKDIRFAPGLFDVLKIDFRMKDCFEYESEIVALVQKPGTTLLLCDGGNKPKEFRTFAPHLKQGDVIAAHDYSPGDRRIWQWSEITEDVITPELGLETFFFDTMKQAAWLCCRKK
jgi:hypothetical protein